MSQHVSRAQQLVARNPDVQEMKRQPGQCWTMSHGLYCSSSPAQPMMRLQSIAEQAVAQSPSAQALLQHIFMLYQHTAKLLVSVCMVSEQTNWPH